MAISEEAYNALKRLKREGEFFSDVILRITRRASLLEYIESTEFSQELADKIEEVYKAREVVKGKAALRLASGDNFVIARDGSTSIIVWLRGDLDGDGMHYY